MEITAEKLNEAFDKSTLTFRDRAAALANFKVDREIVIDDESGELFAKYDSEVLALDEALLRFGLDNRALIDGRSAPRSGAGGRNTELCKSEMTTQDKVRYIAQFGADAFEKLPSRPITTSEVKTKQDWMKLPLKEKVRRTKENPNAFAELPNAASGQPYGTFINREAIAKIAKIRPGTKRLG